MKTSIVIFLCLLASLACCKDETTQDPNSNPDPEPTLPPITAEGKNTFGCLVNSRVFLPNQYLDLRQCNYYPFRDSKDLYGTFQIVASKDEFTDDKYTGMTIKLYNRVFGIGKHLLYTDHRNKDILALYQQNKDYYNFSVTDTNNFIFISRLDTVNRIVAGTFQYNVINYMDNKDTVKVTDGRFDFKF